MKRYRKNKTGDWYRFSRKARRGIFLLLFIFLFVAILPRMYYNFFVSTPKYRLGETIDYKMREKENVFPKHQQYTPPKESFDPNKYTVADWMAVGLTKNQALSAVHYIQAGAVMRIKSDVKRLYGVTPKLYHLLEPKIDLPDYLPKETRKRIQEEFYEKKYKNKTIKDESPSKQKIPLASVPINKATKEELQNVPGIGSYYAEEIIKIRKEYGGIVSFNQLLDLYKMDKKKLDSIIPYFVLDANDIHKININTATKKELQKHPLITREMAKSIVYYRTNYKKYTALDQLLLSPYITLKDLKKMKPYLKVK